MANKKLLVVKKYWVKIIAPKIFKESPLGETLTADASKMVNRFLSVSLASITNEPQKQNISIKFKITGLKEGRLETEIYGLKILPSAVKRLVRRNKCKIDDSFVIQTKDQKIVRIKPIIITRGKTTNSALKTIIQLTRAHITLKLSKITYDEFVQELIGKRFHQDIIKKLKKIYPIGIFDIRQFCIIPANKKGVKILKPAQETATQTEKEETQQTAQAEQ